MSFTANMSVITATTFSHCSKALVTDEAPYSAVDIVERRFLSGFLHIEVFNLEPRPDQIAQTTGGNMGKAVTRQHVVEFSDQ